MKKRLLLIGWDSADWKLIHPLREEGKLPGVTRLFEGGVSGNLATLEPQLSPMLWTSIATGKMAYHHGVKGFTEVDPVSGGIVPVSAATRQCKTLWEILGTQGLRSHVVSWFATQGEQGLNGKMVSNMYGHVKGATAEMEPAEWPKPLPGTYWPPELAAELDERRIIPADIDGDTISAFVPAGDTVDQQRDRRLQQLAEKLAEAFSVQAAACHLMQSDPEWDFMAIYFRSIDEICHLFMHYHPPKMAGIPEDDFQLYQHVVNGAYRAHDLMLQRLLHLAGPETAVVLVSDHGFHSDHLRPKFTPRVPAGITVWHRSQGIFLAKGPGFQADAQVHGARLLDIAPTVLHYFGLPIGADMEGRVLSECFTGQRPVETIPTWETGESKTSARGSLTEEDSKALLEQFVALGYIDEVSADPTEAADETNRENQWNLARACLYGGKYELALPLLEDCFNAYPERTDYAQLLARCQFQLGLLDEAEETLQVCLEGFGHNHAAQLVMGSIELERGNHAAALAHFDVVRAKDPDNTQMLHYLADAYLALRKWAEAKSTAERLLELDPASPQAQLILARYFLHCEKPEQAAEAALAATGLEFANPRGHFLLGLALSQLEQWGAAAHALRNHLQLKPKNGIAYRLLARACRAQGHTDQALEAETRSRVLRIINQGEINQRLASLRGLTAQRSTARQAERQRRREAAATKAAEEAAEEAAIQPLDFTLVSGLPRSGTSLMMQLLRAAGLEPMHDGKRSADDDNQEGYWEWEEIKSLAKQPRIIEQAEGKVIKIISALLPHLPPKHRYKILFMRRPVSQVVDSQWRMLANQGMLPKAEKAHLIATQETHVAQILASLRQSPRIELLEVDFPAFVADPLAWLPRLREFMGESFSGTDEMLTAVVKPQLFRQRGDAGREP
jgi:predicted AlkP superfamily phosphohydrolase/phosphomutase/tetratricopeptide (TPR) repeat protein